MIKELRSHQIGKGALRVTLDFDEVRKGKVEYLKKTSGIGITAELFRALVDIAYEQAIKEEPIN